MKRILFTLLVIGTTIISSNAQTAHTGMRGLTGLEITAEMAPGVNLYNTLDAVGPKTLGLDSETWWGQPYTTIEMIAAMKDKGFKTLRLPVTWFNHMGEYPDYKIEEAWMDRVEEVANYAFVNNMYVIINIHHDDLKTSRPGTWLTLTYEKQDAVTDQLEKVWTQIATRFKDYGDYLIFETLNEPREPGSADEWTGGTAEHRDVVNQLNLAAVNAIRSTGGNNASRFIMVPQVAANLNAAIEDLIIPNNDTNVIVSVHSYAPHKFTSDNPDVTTWGTEAEKKSLRNQFIALADRFVKNGQAVVVGEWGAADKDNYADRVTYTDIYVKACKDGNLTPIAWRYPFDRTTLEWNDPLITQAIFRPYNENTIVVEDLILNVEKDTLDIGEELQLEFSVVPFEAVSPTGFIWTSYNKDVATVSDDGLVTATGKGRAKITLTVVGKVAECKLVVMEKSTGVTDDLLKNIEVYPNPVSNQLNVELSGLDTKVELYGLDGKLLISTNTNEEHLAIDVTAFKQGTYLLRIVSQGYSATKKIIIEN